jgi:hypothetical protein
MIYNEEINNMKKPVISKVITNNEYNEYKEFDKFKSNPVSNEKTSIIHKDLTFPQKITEDNIHETKLNRRLTEHDEGMMHTGNYIYDPVLKRDMHALDDKFYPPWRRMPRHSYPISLRKLINIPTQGYHDNFHYMGNLIRNADEKVVQLFGREVYPGSQTYEYYGITVDPNGLQSKFTIDKNNKKELTNDDEVALKEFDTSRGKFKVHLHNIEEPRYDPYVLGY